MNSQPRPLNPDSRLVLNLGLRVGFRQGLVRSARSAFDDAFGTWLQPAILILEHAHAVNVAPGLPH